MWLLPLLLPLPLLLLLLLPLLLLLLFLLAQFPSRVRSSSLPPRSHERLRTAAQIGAISPMQRNATRRRTVLGDVEFNSFLNTSTDEPGLVVQYIERDV